MARFPRLAMGPGFGIGVGILVAICPLPKAVFSQVSPAQSTRVLPRRSVRPVDSLLQLLEATNRSKDLDGFVGLFAADFEPIDVGRRIHIRGIRDWRAQTLRLNASHRDLWRSHFGRIAVGDWVIAKVEWGGTVRAEALPGAATDRGYRYSGIALMLLQGGRIRRQILYGDVTTLNEQLGVRP